MPRPASPGARPTGPPGQSIAPQYSDQQEAHRCGDLTTGGPPARNGKSGMAEPMRHASHLFPAWSEHLGTM
ncbi:hypothetical protein NDU88_005656 [Pleurodeles waltl]|uniref:Uncharacterized protein n=1 Tax=Pleurodeles waltl TaxID=8319 RepID=A0AAV7MX31_PLEWA|nr:hypothetical protein NDU88_005656 [Pleurodeles waltl]